MNLGLMTGHSLPSCIGSSLRQDASPPSLRTSWAGKETLIEITKSKVRKFKVSTKSKRDSIYYIYGESGQHLYWYYHLLPSLIHSTVLYCLLSLPGLLVCVS